MFKLYLFIWVNDVTVRLHFFQFKIVWNVQKYAIYMKDLSHVWTHFNLKKKH